MKQIFYSIAEFFPAETGAEKVARVLARDVTSTGQSSLVVTLQLDKNWERKQLIDGITVYRIPVFRLFGANKMGRIGKWLYGIGLSLFLWKKSNDYSLLHAHGCSFFSFVGIFISRILRKKILLTVHGNRDIRELKRIFKKRIYKHFLYFDKVISVNKNILNDLKDIGFPEHKILTVYNGVDTTKYTNVPRRANSSDMKTIIFVGALRPVKNVDFLIKTVSLIRQKRQDIRLLIVGNGPLENELKILSKKIAGEHFISFAGRQENVRPFLRSSDIFVLPSKEEGISIALLEAMALALPCIASNVDGNREVIRHGRNGLLFEPCNPGHLEKLITKILDEPDYGKKLGQKARTTVEQRFSLECMVKEYAICYNALCMDSSGRSAKHV